MLISYTYTKPRFLRKAICLLVVFQFLFSDLSFALAPAPGSQNPAVRREAELLNYLVSGRLMFAQTPEDERFLKELNYANALLLSHGKILVAKELKNNPLKLIRTIIHEEIEAIMQVLAREDRAAYVSLINMILSQDNVRQSYNDLFAPGQSPDLSDELLANDIVARAFELLILKADRLVADNEITAQESAFLKAIEPGINASKHNYFTGVFWDANVREAKIRVAIANGVKFSQVAQKKAVPAATAGRREMPQDINDYLRLMDAIEDMSFTNYYEAVKNMVNPDDRDGLVGLYAGSGADVKSFLLSTNATEAYFVDLSPLDARKFLAQDAIDTSRQAKLKLYDHDKKGRGYGISYGIGMVDVGMFDIEIKIMHELEELEVYMGPEDIVDNKDGSITVKFLWAYPGRDAKEYSITFIRGDVTTPGLYPQRLRDALDKGIDIYYQKAGYHLLEEPDTFVPLIASRIRPGGFSITDDAYCAGYTSITDVNLDEYFSGFTARGQLISNGLAYAEKDLRTSQAKRRTAQSMEYGWHVWIRQKITDDAGRVPLPEASLELKFCDKNNAVPQSYLALKDAFLEKLTGSAVYNCVDQYDDIEFIVRELAKNSFDAIVDKVLAEGIDPEEYDGMAYMSLGYEGDDLVITSVDNGMPVTVDKNGNPVKRERDWHHFGGAHKAVGDIEADLKKMHGTITFLPLASGTKVVVRIPVANLPEGLQPNNDMNMITSENRMLPGSGGMNVDDQRAAVKRLLDEHPEYRRMDTEELALLIERDKPGILEVYTTHEEKVEALRGIIAKLFEPKANPLVAEALREKMEANGGRITFHDFMQVCHYHPEGGYYTGNAARIGVAQSDHFGTFPVYLSPGFGRAIAKQLFQMWSTMGSPGEFTIVEMGAGNGVLARDILVGARESYPEFYEAIKYLIVEISPGLITEQAATLTRDEGVSGIVTKVQWLDSPASEAGLKNIEGVFISNELPDDFPVHRVKFINGKLQEAYVSYDAVSGKFVEAWGDVSSPEVSAYIDEIGRITKKDPASVMGNNEVAVNLQATGWYRGVARSLKRGYIITIDYSSPDLTPPEIYGTRSVRTAGSDWFDLRDAYLFPGGVNLTSDIYFPMLAKTGTENGLSTNGLIEQEKFLTNLWDDGDVPDVDIAGYDFFVLVQSKAVPATSLQGLNGAATSPEDVLAGKPIGYIVSAAVESSDERLRAAAAALLLRDAQNAGGVVVKVATSQQDVSARERACELVLKMPFSAVRGPLRAVAVNVDNRERAQRAAKLIARLSPELRDEMAKALVSAAIRAPDTVVRDRASDVLVEDIQKEAARHLVSAVLSEQDDTAFGRAQDILRKIARINSGYKQLVVDDLVIITVHAGISAPRSIPLAFSIDARQAKSALKRFVYGSNVYPRHKKAAIKYLKAADPDFSAELKVKSPGRAGHSKKKMHAAKMNSYSQSGYARDDDDTGEEPVFAGVEAQASADLLENPWMKNILARREGRAETDAKFIRAFLDNSHPLVRETLAEIDAASFSDDEIVAEADKMLSPRQQEDEWVARCTYSKHLGRNMTVRELFLRPTAGQEDVTQILLSAMDVYASPDSVESLLKHGREGMLKRGARLYYLLMKALDVLSCKDDLVLIQKQDIAALAADLSEKEFRPQLAGRLLSLADLMMPADTPEKREGLGNFLALVDTLAEESPEFKRMVMAPEYQARIGEIRNLLGAGADGKPVQAGDNDGDGFIHQGSRSKKDFAVVRESIKNEAPVAAYRKRLSDVVRNDLIHAGFTAAERMKFERQQEKLSSGAYKIYGFESIVRGEDDFFLGSNYTQDGEIFVASDIMAELENRGPPDLADEYLLHEFLCPVIGHYPSILLQQKIFPAHYPDSAALAAQTAEKPYKGLLGAALRDTITIKAAGLKIKELVASIDKYFWKTDLIRRPAHRLAYKLDELGYIDMRQLNTLYSGMLRIKQTWRLREKDGERLDSFIGKCRSILDMLAALSGRDLGAERFEALCRPAGVVPDGADTRYRTEYARGILKDVALALEMLAASLPEPQVNLHKRLSDISTEMKEYLKHTGGNNLPADKVKGYGGALRAISLNKGVGNTTAQALAVLADKMNAANSVLFAEPAPVPEPLPPAPDNAQRGASAEPARAASKDRPVPVQQDLFEYFKIDLDEGVNAQRIEITQPAKGSPEDITFTESMKGLAQMSWREYNTQAEKAGGQAAAHSHPGQSLILYADDILENAAIIDLEHTLKNILAKENVLTGGKIILYAVNKAHAVILERMIRRADPNIEIVTVMSDDIQVKDGEAKEADALLRIARSKGAREILGLIRGPAATPEELAVFARNAKLPIVLVGPEKGIYSFAQAVRLALDAKVNNGATNGWLMMLPPVRALTEEIKMQYERYQLALQTLVAA